MKWAELHGNPGINHAGSVQGALLTWEILAHFAVGSISFFYFFLYLLFILEKTPLWNKPIPEGIKLVWPYRFPRPWVF
jgi:hypothetical protein